MQRLAYLVAVLALSACSAVDRDPTPPSAETPMTSPDTQPGPSLGAFSISLSVQDLTASHAFYAKLGFEVVGGDAAQGWLVLKSGTTKIGLFQGMFERNMLTFNPGWDSERATPAQFDDVREIQRQLEARGLELTSRADPASTGPASLTLEDPDGNPILIDQHVDRP